MRRWILQSVVAEYLRHHPRLQILGAVCLVNELSPPFVDQLTPYGECSATCPIDAGSVALIERATLVGLNLELRVDMNSHGVLHLAGEGIWMMPVGSSVFGLCAAFLTYDPAQIQVANHAQRVVSARERQLDDPVAL
jgi:hypothetical protein